MIASVFSKVSFVIFNIWHQEHNLSIQVLQFFTLDSRCQHDFFRPPLVLVQWLVTADRNAKGVRREAGLHELIELIKFLLSIAAPAMQCEVNVTAKAVGCAVHDPAESGVCQQQCFRQLPAQPTIARYLCQCALWALLLPSPLHRSPAGGTTNATAFLETLCVGRFRWSTVRAMMGTGVPCGRAHDERCCLSGCSNLASNLGAQQRRSRTLIKRGKCLDAITGATHRHREDPQQD